MTCPVCGGKNRVIDSRSDVEVVYRKRLCLECGHTFYTAEVETEYSEDYRKLNKERYKRNVKCQAESR